MADSMENLKAEIATLRAEQTRLREALERVNNRYYLADDDRDFVNAALSSTPTPEHSK